MNTLILFISISFFLIIKDFFIYKKFTKKFSKDYNIIKKYENNVSIEIQKLQDILLKVKSETQVAKTLSHEAVKKIQFMGTEFEQQGKETYQCFSLLWDEMKLNFKDLSELSTEKTSNLLRKMEKLCLEAEHHVSLLDQKTDEAKRVFHIFEGSSPLDAVLQEISDEKYTRAKSLIEKGHSVVEAAKATGLSVTEVSLTVQR